MKCFYPNRIALLEDPGVPMFLYHSGFHAIVGEALINRAEVKNGAYYYFFDSFTRYPYQVLSELITTDEKVPRMAKRGRWLYIYISKETVNKIRNFQKCRTR